MSMPAQNVAVTQLVQSLIDADTMLMDRFGELSQTLPPNPGVSKDFVPWLKNAVATMNDAVDILLTTQESLLTATGEHFFPSPG